MASATTAADSSNNSDNDKLLPSSSKPVPDGYTALHESTTEIIIPNTSLPDTNGKANTIQTDDTNNKEQQQRKSVFLKSVFLNPVQEYNRDLSIIAIRCWSEIFAEEKMERKAKADERRVAKKQKQHVQSSSTMTATVKDTDVEEKEDDGNESYSELNLPSKKKQRLDSSNNETTTSDNNGDVSMVEPSEDNTIAHDTEQKMKFTCFEGLSATGIRSIRYAKEIPLLKWVLANDLSSSAVKSIKANVEWNDLGTPITSHGLPDNAQSNDCKVKINEGDCSAVLYANRHPKAAFDCVDLDPYGTAAPFIDGAVQATANGGLLCVTCTDMAVLAGSNYPEKCFSNYGGTPIRAEFNHEMALRLVLHTISTSAARYGRYIKPLLSLSIDFYVRVFVRVYTSALETKRALSHTGTVLVSNHSQDWLIQPFGTLEEKKSNHTSQILLNFHTAASRAPSVRSPEDGTVYHVGGPIWIGPLHDPDFLDRMLEHLDGGKKTYGTHARLKGMITIARHELPAPFYFTPGRLSGAFRCRPTPLNDMFSAILNAGYKASRSHAAPGSIKTDAPSSVIHDIMRAWVIENPVKMENIKEGSPARVLLNKPISNELKDRISFKLHENTKDSMLDGIKVVRYQVNPLPHWGPQTKAASGRRNKK